MFGSILRKRRATKRPAISQNLERNSLSQRLPDALQHELDLILEAAEFSMTSPERVLGLIRAVDYLVEANVLGDIVECGVWRGGSMLVAARTLLRHLDCDRTLWLYDTFEGMSEPTDNDVDLRGNAAEGLLKIHDLHDRNGVWCVSRLEEVQQTMARSGYPGSQVNYVEGKVESTLPVSQPERIALLRLDTDWYQSTRVELEILFPLLVDGGVLIVDDYGHWQGCRQAVDEYFAETGQRIHLARMDYTGRIGIKAARNGIVD